MRIVLPQLNSSSILFP